VAGQLTWERLAAQLVQQKYQFATFQAAFEQILEQDGPWEDGLV
jgi:hypothetical protein